MKGKIFYGWYIVTAGVILQAFVGGVTSYGFTALVNPIRDALGWSMAQISLAMTLRGIESGALSPFVGRAVDRWPARHLVLIGVIIIGLGFITLSRVTNLVMFYVSFAIIALGGSLGTHMTTTTSVVRWFKRNVGKANGLLAVGIALGGVFTPIMVRLIETFTWRTTLVILAFTIWLVGIPLSFVFRSRPQDYGMVPDGKLEETGKGTARTDDYDFGTSVREALRQRLFWLMAIATTLQMVGVGAVMSHVLPYLISLGVNKETASLVAMLFPLVSMPARFAFGWLSDIVKKKYMFITSLALTSIGLLAFSLITKDAWWFMVIFVGAYGLSLGGVVPIRPPMIREYFGVKNFGAMFGLLSVFVTMGMVAGPPLAGLVYDIRGTYHPIWLVMSLMCLTGLLLALLMPFAVRPSTLPRAVPAASKPQ